MIVVPYMIGDVVAKANTALLAQLQVDDPTITGINYQYGPLLEITTTLTQMSKNDATSEQKYPLVCLVFPIVENHDGKVVGIDQNTPIRLIIARWSNATDKTADRYAKNFIPILYPIYEELLEQLDNDPRFLFQSADLLTHIKTDYPFYGGETTADLQKANIFNDFVDAIELKINLKINTSNCQ
jgi:hypothetical protein